ncbi:hypothetical protein HDA40_002146 [Hamadaea flava]|uniref:Uncharacterized protein n=1 Tax=Hamadaea flava TaxID=1742688 RepID=A0ABV8LKQ2_9ACTN|nr:hypothetical protein [Hamadaea flava]MCP2323639.1 hypothetical protein [Hamadaea flava]
MFEPSPLIDSMLDDVARRCGESARMRAVTRRVAEFASPTQARLAGLAQDPAARTVADQAIDAWWSDPRRQQRTLDSVDFGEVIIGGGFHAAVYAAVRVQAGHPKPVVLEASSRAGGTFAMTERPVFYLNSHTRPGLSGPAGDADANLNYLPGAPIQTDHLPSGGEYQTNTDMALVIRLALAQYADVVTSARVASVGGDDDGVLVETDGGLSLVARRVIDARGLGDPIAATVANGTTILTFDQFMTRMATIWPLRGIRRAAVIGGGDSGKCAVEALVELGPQPFVAAAALDHVTRIDWYAADLPTTCEQWQNQMRGRYQAIGQFLRPRNGGGQRLTVIARQANPIAVPDGAIVDGRMYDLVVMCVGNTETLIDGLDLKAFDEYALDDGTRVARKHPVQPVFRVGPHARLPFNYQERQDGVADLPGNAVSMFRTSGKTAALAATLPSLTRD